MYYVQFHICVTFQSYVYLLNVYIPNIMYG